MGSRKAPCKQSALTISTGSRLQSDRAGYLAGAEAPSTHVDMAGSTVNQSLDTTNVRLPGTVGATMRVRNLNTEGHALAANIALCHFPAPPSLVHCITDIIIPQQGVKSKLFFTKKSLLQVLRLWRWKSLKSRGKGGIIQSSYRLPLRKGV